MFSAVWLLHNLTLDGKLSLRDDKKTAYVSLNHLLQWQTSLENVTMCVRIRRKSLLIGWIHSLGTMSASAYTENVA